MLFFYNGKGKSFVWYHILLLVLTVSFAAYAHEGYQSDNTPGAKLLDETNEMLMLNDYEGAMRVLDDYNAHFASGATIEDRSRAAYYRYQASWSEIEAQNKEGATDLKSVQDAYEQLVSLFRSTIDSPGTGQPSTSSGETISALQKINLDHATRLVKRGDFDSALSLYDRCLGDSATYKSILDIKLTKNQVQDPEKVTSVREFWGIKSEESILEDAISVAMGKMNRDQKDSSKETLCKFLTRFLENYRDSPYAGAYMSTWMNLVGKFDLDKLKATFDACRDKQHVQYIYSTLGLANRLISAGRQKEALPYLLEIKKKGIEPSRQAELYLDLGESYFALGDKKQALECFLAVRQMSSNYDVSYYIQSILGDNKETDKQLIKELFELSDNLSEVQMPSTGAAQTNSLGVDNKTSDSGKEKREPVLGSISTNFRNPILIVSGIIVFLLLAALASFPFFRARSRRGKG